MALNLKYYTNIGVCISIFDMNVYGIFMVYKLQKMGNGYIEFVCGIA